MARFRIVPGDEQVAHWEEDGTWTSGPTPPDDVVLAGGLVLYAGHEYDQDDDVVAELAASGVDVEVLEVEG